MSNVIKIRRGANIKLKGTADKVSATATSDTYVVKPTNFHGIIPKLVIKQGDDVKVGSTLFFSKENPDLKFVSPVSGEVVEVLRGDKRKLLEIRILADKEQRFESFQVAEPSKLKREDIIKVLMESGNWPFIIQRPYDVIADSTKTPKAIFISAFDTNPLAADPDYILHGRDKDFQAGIEVLRKLTSGKVHLNVNADTTRSEVFLKAQNVQQNKFSGPHPSGNIGVQIHHVDPINKGEVIWYCRPQDVAAIGSFFNSGKFDASRIVALTGSEVTKPKYYKTTIGASIKNIVAGNISAGDGHRYISGNPLTGDQISAEGYLGYYDAQITVLPEGKEPQFMGWLTPNFDKLSFSRTFFSWLTPSKEFSLTTAMNGEERAFVVSGEYEKVFPFDIYPVQLLKAILAEDVELMENLGIYEVSPEDFALCEFTCTSKIDIQPIVRKGLDLIKQECG